MQPTRLQGIRGPRFYEEDGKLMFVRYIDGSTREGPRAATEADIDAHPAAFAALTADEDDATRLRRIIVRQPRASRREPA